MPRFDDSPAYNRNPLVGRQSALQTSLRTPPCVHESGEWLRSAVHGAKGLAIALAACGALPSQLLAADSVVSAGELPEIVVTAQKRAEDVQRVLA